MGSANGGGGVSADREGPPAPYIAPTPRPSSQKPKFSQKFPEKFLAQ